MKTIKLFCLAILFGCSHLDKPLKTESFIDIFRYQGTWQAQAWLPQFFTNKCNGQKAYYTLENNILKIKNECLRDNIVIDSIEGIAIPKNKENSILEISFDNFFIKLFGIKGDYEIMKINQDYTIALLGSKNRKSLWILSRNPSINKDELKEYLNQAEKEGFDIKKLIFKM